VWRSHNILVDKIPHDLSGTYIKREANSILTFDVL